MCCQLINSLSHRKGERRVSDGVFHEPESTFTHPAFDEGRASGRGSLTVETALALPIFIFVLMSVIWLFRVELLQQQIRSALYVAADGEALAAHITDDKAFDLSPFGLDLTAGALMQTGVDYDALGDLIVGGRAGIVCTSDDSGENYVNLSAACIVRIPVSFFGERVMTIRESVTARKWTGFDPTENAAGEGEEMVYITPEGEAYHRSRACSYLNPSIKTVAYESLSVLRNSSGHRYYPCPICGKGISGGKVYITTYGENYHSSVSCSGLKRTVYCVPISEVGGRHACSKCGG
ncbi:MAG: pilus assembly protein [Eubacterium sp.]|nr:pilus assembly protein [Eubacterium sp.]